MVAANRFDMDYTTSLLSQRFIGRWPPRRSAVAFTSRFGSLTRAHAPHTPNGKTSGPVYCQKNNNCLLFAAILRQRYCELSIGTWRQMQSDVVCYFYVLESVCYPSRNGPMSVANFVSGRLYFKPHRKINGKSIALSFRCLEVISCRCLPATECERRRAPAPVRMQFDLSTVNSFSLHSEKLLSPNAHSLR